MNEVKYTVKLFGAPLYEAYYSDNLIQVKLCGLVVSESFQVITDELTLTSRQLGFVRVSRRASKYGTEKCVRVLGFNVWEEALT